MPHRPISNEGEAEESYFVSLSDLMVGMLFIFIILLMAFALNYRVAQNDQQKASEQAISAQQRADRTKSSMEIAEQQLAAAKRDIDEVRTQLAAAKKEAAAQARAFGDVTTSLTNNDEVRRQMLRRLEGQLKAQGVEVLLDEENGILRLPEEMLFDSGKADLRPEGREKIRLLSEALFPVLTEFEKNSANVRLEAILIEGHTDDVPIRGRELDGNWILSTQRAVNTYLELVTSKPELETVKNPQGKPLLGVSGYANCRPIMPNDSDLGRRSNRRIAMRFLMTSPTRGEVEKVRDKMKGALKATIQ